MFLFPKPGSGWSAMTADVELVKGHDGKWRVDYWMPKRFHGPPSLSTAAKAQAKAKAQAARHQGQALASDGPEDGRSARRRAGGGAAEAEHALVGRAGRAARA